MRFGCGGLSRAATARLPRRLLAGDAERAPDLAEHRVAPAHAAASARL